MNVPSVLRLRTISRARPLSRDEVFPLLKNQRRRYILSYFSEGQTDAVSLGELVDHIAAEETGLDLERIDPEDRTAVYVSLHQTHLPKLEAFGIVDYDREEKKVHLTDKGWQLTLYLNEAPERKLGWDRVFLGLSSIWLFVLLATLVASLTRTVPDPVFVLAPTATFLLVSVLYVWSTWKRSRPPG